MLLLTCFHLLQSDAEDDEDDPMDVDTPDTPNNIMRVMSLEMSNKLLKSNTKVH
jgi:hypothetical protein